MCRPNFYAILKNYQPSLILQDYGFASGLLNNINKDEVSLSMAQCMGISTEILGCPSDKIPLPLGLSNVIQRKAEPSL